ncbi:Multidrug resistance protein MdtC [Polystyrenella longa]|uniref:Multidrug resistance protein MdtC n=1 Tax=Polystyrenella longa TaxID=2528007 RepID=A0A518CJG2_9PLAN|nr:efflux RND transporter permease subunit [Polystyrenella longa]QDU79347.1 Multidrug resistance protein MdtC [Polystyrenella longa]
MSLTKISVHRPITTLMCSLVVLILGYTAFERLPIDLMPEFTYPTLTIEAVYDGAGPEEVETQIARPLEQAISTVSGVEQVASFVTEANCRVFARFAWGTDLDEAASDMRARVDRARRGLPDEVDAPVVRKYNSNDRPLLFVSYQLGDKEDLITASQYAEETLLPMLERIEGVAAARIRGHHRREIQINLDRHKLESLNMSVNEVVEALRRESINQPAGNYEQGNIQLLVRSKGEFQNITEMKQSVVRSDDKSMIRLIDVADVIDGEEERTERTRVNGVPGIMFMIYKQTGANTVEVSDKIHEEIENYNRSSQDGTLVLQFDRADFIRDSIANMQQTGLYGMALAVVVLFVFLQNLRSTFVIAISIPLAILATIVLIYFKGYTLNLVTLGGLTLGIGLLVDNSIVVIESIFRKIDDGMEIREAAVKGTNEVASAIVASTLTTLIVFLPLLFIEGRTGITLEQMAWVVSFSLFCSLISSLSLTPVLTAYWLKNYSAASSSETKEPFSLLRPIHRLNSAVINVMEATYRVTLGLCLRHANPVGFALLLAFSLCVGLMPRIGTEYFPETDEGDLIIIARMASGIQVEQLNEQALALEKLIQTGVKEEKLVTTTVGGTANDADDWNESIYRVKFPKKSERTRTIEEIRKEMADKIGAMPGMKVTVRTNSQSGMSMIISNNSNAGKLQLEIRGHNTDTAERIAERLVTRLETIPGLINVEADKQNRRPEMSARINREKASLMGVSVSDISQALETSVKGTQAIVYREDGDEFNVLVRLDPDDRKKITDVEQVGVRSGSGAIVPLRNLIEFEQEEVPMNIRRNDKERVLDVHADVEERDLGSVVEDVTREINEMDLPVGYSIHIAGNWKEQQESFRALTFGLCLAVVLMYMVMASQFESLWDPLMILSALPLGVIGVVLTLWLTNTTLNVQSFIGLIILSGIVVNNAIVLVDYLNQLRRDNKFDSLDELILHGSIRRFRPIMMTTLTTILAMLPIAFGWGEGSEVQAPMARVVVGGLISGTLITLIAIPLIYRTSCRWINRSV